MENSNSAQLRSSDIGSRRLAPKLEPLEGETISQFRLRQRKSKRRRQIFRRLYCCYYEWQSQYETGETGDIWPTPDGEEVYMPDLLVGLPLLPPRQRLAFELHTLNGMTELSAAREMGFVRWSTPVQQYNNMAISTLITAYDKKQDGSWDLQRELTSRKKRRRTRTLIDHAEFSNQHISVRVDRIDPTFYFTEKLAIAKAETVEGAFEYLISKGERYRNEYLMDETNENFLHETVDYLGIWSKDKAD